MPAAGQAVRFPWRTVTLIVVVALAIIVPFLLAGARINAWAEAVIAQSVQNRLLAGCLLAGLLATDILVPVPSSLVSTACGMVLGFWIGTLASFVGMSITTAIGYLMGRYAAAPVGRLIGEAEFAMLEAFHRRHGVWLLLALRPVPVLAEASAVFSGVSRLPAARVVAVMALGNAAVSAVYAAIGAWGTCTDSFIPAFLVALALSGVMMVILQKRVKDASEPPQQREQTHGK
ncbi:MAG TPA: VTT domain-containing protein [Kiritimatiellia bacterium]|nr:VTT domain-containing protein [Kiritimatiellia bacterium]HRU71080.1 VTT domain-containing protein [Kiritimatiellia bacterium]